MLLEGQAQLLAEGPVEARRSESQGAAAKIEYGEPIGIKLEGKDGAPPFEIAFAVTKGKDAEKNLGPMVTTMSKVVYGCPEFVAAAKGGQTAQLAFVVESGKAHVPPVENAPASTECLAKSIEGRMVLDPASEKLEVLAQIRVGGAPDSATGGGK